MNVPNASEFIQDANASRAVSEAIAEAVGVPVSYVSSRVIAARRLDSEKKAASTDRRLAHQRVKVLYTISVPVSSTVGPSTVTDRWNGMSTSALSNAVQAKTAMLRDAKGSPYRTSIVSKTSLAQRAVPTPKPSSHPACSCERADRNGSAESLTENMTYCGKGGTCYVRAQCSSNETRCHYAAPVVTHAPATHAPPTHAPPIIPQVFDVLAPNGPASVAGTYELVPNRIVNHRPLWKHKTADRWFHVMKSGRWGIAGAGDGKFQSDAAYVFCNDKSGIAASPNATSCNVGSSAWQRWTGKAWSDDSAIKIVRHIPPFMAVSAPHGPQACSGTYALVHGKMVNNKPLWKHVTESRWIYFMTRGSWGIVGSEDFHKNLAFVMCGDAPGARMPPEMHCVWKRYDGHAWVADKDISFRSMATAPTSAPAHHPATHAPTHAPATHAAHSVTVTTTVVKKGMVVTSSTWSQQPFLVSMCVLLFGLA